MTFYFMASEMAGFDPSDASSAETTNADFFDSGFSRAGVHAGQGSPVSYATTPTATLPDDFFLHFAFKRNTAASTSHTLVALVSGSSEVFRVLATGSTLQMQINVSSVWTNLGAAVTYARQSLNHLDLYIEGNSGSGSATLFLSGAERVSATGDLSAVASIDTARFYGIDTAAGCTISQCFASDTSTIGGRIFSVPVSGAGASSGWTGTYAEVDEAVYSDADFVNSGSAGQVSTFSVAAPALTSYAVRAVGVYARAKRNTTGPQNLQLVLRVSGTDYTSSTKALGLGYKSIGHIWETDPSTSAAWTNTPIATLQAGVKSIA